MSDSEEADCDGFDGSVDGGENSRDNDQAKPSLSCRVYVTNIPLEYRWQDLKDLFRNQVGEVQFAKVFFNEAGESKGSGIVEFSARATVARCIEKMHGFDVKGRQLTVTEGTADIPEVDDERPRKRARVSRTTDTVRGGEAATSSNRVYVSNLPYAFRWQDLKDLFRDEVGEVVFAKMLVDEMNKAKGCGIVEFCDPEMVEKCLEKMQGFELKGRKLAIKDDSGNMRDRHGHLLGSGGVRGDRFGPSSINFSGEGNYGRGNTYGLSQAFLQSLNINVPLCNRVFVANLDYKVDKKKLKEVFRLAGRVTRVDLQAYEDGHSKGYAVVEYDHPVEAVQAISMLHGQVLFDRPMMVRMDHDVKKLPEGLQNVGVGLGLNGECLKDVVHNLPSLSYGVTQETASNSALQLSNFLTNMNSIAGNAALSSLISSQSILQGLLAPGTDAQDTLQVTQDTMNNLSKALLSGHLTQNTPFTANQNISSRQELNLIQSNSPAFETMNHHLDRELPTGSGTNSHLNSQLLFERENQNIPFSKNVNIGPGRNSDFVSGEFMSESVWQTAPLKSNVRNNPQATSSNYLETKHGNQSVPDYTDFSSASGTGVNLFGSSKEGSDASFNNRAQMNSNMNQTNSKKLLIKHIPRTVGYKNLFNKFCEFGEVQHVERKDNSDILLVYSSNWEAEKAVKCLNLARINGNTIEANLC